MKNLIITSIIFLFIFSSCEKKLDIDLPDADKKIVINGLMNPDSLIKVKVSKSMNVLDNGTVEFLSDAVVKLYKNDAFVEELSSLNSGSFISSIFPEINSEYQITVDYSGLNSVYADLQLKTSVNIRSIDTLMELQIYDYGDGYIDTSYIMHFKIKIKDDVQKADYYFLSLRGLSPVYDWEGENYMLVGYEETNMYFNSEDPIFRNTNGWFSIDGMDGIVLSDELFNGNEYTIDLEHYINQYNEFGEPGELQIPPVFYVKLLTVTDDIFKYITSYNLNQYTQYDPFAQPVRIFSNVQNGLGLVSGYTMSIDSVVIGLK